MAKIYPERWKALSPRQQGVLLIVLSLTATLVLSAFLFIGFPVLQISPDLPEDGWRRALSFLIHLPAVPISIGLIVGSLTLISGKSWVDLPRWVRFPGLLFGTVISLVVIYLSFTWSYRMMYPYVEPERTPAVEAFYEHYSAMEENLSWADRCSADDLNCLERMQDEVTRTEGYMNDYLEIYPQLKQGSIIVPMGIGKDDRHLSLEQFYAMVKRYNEKLERAKSLKTRAP